MEKISVRIDDQDILAQKRSTILEVALANKIYIPHLCYHPDLKHAGSCRICLVEMENGQLVTSCRTPVKEGMAIKTKSSEVDRVRRPIVEMLIDNHHMDCRNCAKKGRCKLQRIMAYMHIDKKRVQRLRLPKGETLQDTSNPFFYFDHNKCVLCGICVRTCQEIQKVSAIDFADRGYITKIATLGDKPIAQSRCESCGECVVRCPVGALVPKNLRRPSHEVKTICPYCGVGCGIFLGIRDNVVINVRGDVENPVNNGHLCVKGRFGLSFVNSPDRLTVPLIRKNKGNPPSPPFSKGGMGGFVEVSWDEALELVANKLRNYKGEDFALIASTKCTNEDSYIAQKFARVVMGSNNIDTSARLCHAPSIVALLQANGNRVRRPDSTPMGSDRSPDLSLRIFSDQIGKAACIFAIGTNITDSHPVIGLRVKTAVQNGARLIVVNPREINLCRFADIYLRPYPGTDVALLMGMSRIIVDEGLFDTNFIEERCQNFEEFARSLNDFPLGRVERITGVPREMITGATRVYATTKPAAIIWSTGVTQHSHGTDSVLALVNLALLTGNIGRYSSGLYPLWGQNNAQGACDMGCLPDFYPDYQAVEDPEVRKRFETAWGVSLNPKPGLTLTEILPAILEGKIKALYIIGSDLVSSIAPTQRIKEALKRAEFIVLQDIFLNETARFADVILPGASFAEKDGTFTNTERRIQKIHKAIELVGNSWPDWQIICELAKRLGSSGFDFNHPEEIMSEPASITPVSHISGFPTHNGRYRFAPLEYRSSAEVSNIDYPSILTTEKSLYSGGLLSRKVEGLNILRGEELVKINPKDARDFGIKDGTMIQVFSRWGEIKVEAKVTDTAPPGVVIMKGFAENAINLLTNPAVDPVAKTPETKVCAVRIVSH
ncbi:MAG: molybdopterin-dependent oxidoreductase [Nitrospirota bacterium]